MKNISPRGKEILIGARDVKTNCQIADELDISQGVVHKHLHKIFITLHVSDRTMAVVKAIKLGIIPLT